MEYFFLGILPTLVLYLVLHDWNRHPERRFLLGILAVGYGSTIVMVLMTLAMRRWPGIPEAAWALGGFSALGFVSFAAAEHSRRKALKLCEQALESLAQRRKAEQEAKQLCEDVRALLRNG